MSTSTENTSSKARSAFLLAVVAALLGSADVHADDLSLTVRLPPGTTSMDGNQARVLVQFTNAGEKDVVILKEFEPLTIFFWFSITTPDGTPLSVPGGGKISFRRGSQRYVTLRNGEFLGLTVKLGDLVTAPLKPGPHSVSVTYANQYGVGCFKGKLKSNKLQVKIR